MADHTKKHEAHVEFKKLQRAQDGKKAMSDYEAEGAAVRAKTERLKALRLARDAASDAESDAAADAADKTPQPKRPASAKKKAAKQKK